jgi:hypothetical protein
MAKFSILVLLAMMTLPAKANCSVADALIKKYGISFSGFEVDLPRIFAPRLEGSRAEDLVVIRLVNKKGFVPDGFSHSALIDVSEKKSVDSASRGISQC